MEYKGKYTMHIREAEKLRRESGNARTLLKSLQDEREGLTSRKDKAANTREQKAYEAIIEQVAEKLEGAPPPPISPEEGKENLTKHLVEKRENCLAELAKWKERIAKAERAWDYECLIDDGLYVMKWAAMAEEIGKCLEACKGVGFFGAFDFVTELRDNCRKELLSNRPSYTARNSLSRSVVEIGKAEAAYEIQNDFHFYMIDEPAYLYDRVVAWNELKASYQPDN